MAIQKKYFKTKPDVCKVRFVFDGDEAKAASGVCLAGDFNGWDQSAAPMSRKNGVFVYNMELPAGSQYRFRYVVDGQTWCNDAQADRYEHSGVGDSLNSVISL